MEPQSGGQKAANEAGSIEKRSGDQTITTLAGKFTPHKHAVEDGNNGLGIFLSEDRS